MSPTIWASSHRVPVYLFSVDNLRHLCRLETLFAHIGAWASTQVPLFTARHLQTWYTHATNEIVLGLYQVAGGSGLYRLMYSRRVHLPLTNCSANKIDPLS